MSGEQTVLFPTTSDFPTATEVPDPENDNSKWCGMPSRGTVAAGALIFAYTTTQIGSMFLGPVAHEYITNRSPLNTTDFGCSSPTSNGTATANAVKCLFNAALVTATAIGGTGGLVAGIVVVGLAAGAIVLYNQAQESDCSQRPSFQKIN